MLATGAAAAQEFEGLRSVSQRARPELDAAGMPVGAFRLYPEMGVGAIYSDNVRASEDDEKNDVALVATPEARMTSESSRYRAELGANAEIARYADLSSEDYEDVRLWTTGSTGIGEGELRGAVRLGWLHQDRTSPDDVPGSKLTKYRDNSVDVAYTYRPGRLFARIDGRLRRLDFDDTRAPTGKVDNDDRDRDIFRGGLRVGYSLSPDVAVYGEALAEKVEYDEEPDENGYRRNSDAPEIRAGAQVELTDVISGEVYLGYQSRDYDDPRFGDSNGAVFGANVLWNVTRLTSIKLEASRSIEETTIAGASGIQRSFVRVGVDHELLRNLVVSAAVEHTKDEFNDITRDDDITGFRVGGRYHMNRNAYLEFGYSYEDQDSSPVSAGGRTFTINQLSVRFVAQI